MDTNAQEFKEGQVWSYRTRPNESDSTVLINKIDSDPHLGQIFHISIRDVSVKDRLAPDGVIRDLSHFPVSKKTLESSLLDCVGTETQNPEYQEGYVEWKQEFDAGRAGVFSIALAEIVRIVEEAVSQ